VDEAIATLLDLQEKHGRKLAAERQLEDLPRQLKGLEAKEAEEKAAFAGAQTRLKELEVQRGTLDGQLKDTEAQVVKYKNQQLSVKKNEEYQALEHEIASLAEKISELEDRELGLMMEIDEAKEELALREKEHAERLDAIRRERELYEKRRGEVEAEVESVRGAYEAARGGVDGAWLGAYDKAIARAKRPPAVVPVSAEHRCGGCHLKVSGEVFSQVRRGGEPVFCDQCGRLLYWEE